MAILTTASETINIDSDGVDQSASASLRKRGGIVPSIGLLIVDIDNTLFDWFTFWYTSFSAMIAEVVEKTHIDRDQLLKEARVVHQRHGTSEYAWLLQELPSVAALPEPFKSEVIEAGRRAYSDARDRTSHLYPDVAETLRVVKTYGTKVVGFTESQSFYTIQRLLRFGLDGVLDALYCTDEHENPPESYLQKVRSRPAEAYRLKKTKVVVLPIKTKKPDPDILLTIVRDFHAKPDQVLYVGDSKMKDVYMAQQAGVYDAYAEYGQSMNKDGYDLLREVSHWTDEDIAKEKLMAVEVTPTMALKSGLSDILDSFKFGTVTTSEESAK